MATTTITTYGPDGNVVETRTVEVPDEQARADLLADRLDQALDGLRTYTNTASPSAAQTTAAVKLLCRVAIALIRLTRNRLDAAD